MRVSQWLCPALLLVLSTPMQSLGQSGVEFEHGTITANGIDIHFVEQGEGPLVLFLHGFPESWYSWRHQLPAVAAAGYRAVALDMRGHGDSDRVGDGGYYYFPDYVADLRSLIAERGFCANCGSSLIYRPLVRRWTDWIVIFTASLDNPEDFGPGWHLGVESQMPWLNIHDDLPRVRSQDSPDLVDAWASVGQSVPEPNLR